MGLRGQMAAASISAWLAPGRPKAMFAADAARRRWSRPGAQARCGRAPRQDRRRGHRRDRSARGPRGDIVKSQDQREQGRLAGARSADHGDGLAGPDMKTGAGSARRCRAGRGRRNAHRQSGCRLRQAKAATWENSEARMSGISSSSSLSRSEAPAAWDSSPQTSERRAEAARGKDRIEQELTERCRVSSLPTGPIARHTRARRQSSRTPWRWQSRSARSAPGLTCGRR